MIACSVKPWDLTSKLEHASTSYQISSDPNMITILDHINDTIEYKETWYSTLVIPENETYYVRSKRTLSDGTVMPWSDIKPVTSEYNIDSLNIIEPIVLDTPSVTIDINEIVNNDLETITILASPMNYNKEGLYSTHWFITTLNGEVIYSKINDTINKDLIVVKKSDIDLYNRDGIIAYAIHKTASGIESNAGYINIELHKKNFTVEDDLSNVDSNVDLTINFTKIDDSLKTNISKIELLNKSNGNLLLSIDSDIDTTKVIINNLIMNSNSKYIVRLHLLEGAITFTYDLFITTI